MCTILSPKYLNVYLKPQLNLVFFISSNPRKDGFPGIVCDKAVLKVSYVNRFNIIYTSHNILPARRGERLLCWKQVVRRHIMDNIEAL